MCSATLSLFAWFRKNRLGGDCIISTDVEPFPAFNFNVLHCTTGNNRFYQLLRWRGTA